ncbi:hypothetical protein IWZ03DRAFT_139914 [Phyllosticta citriasiana]|uniref:Uncharacterized protein n=1 Tax=Phyllosticta citriasiana TaxID=595635 RepID=A0ABR1KTZ3_9PEZI
MWRCCTPRSAPKHHCITVLHRILAGSCTVSSFLRSALAKTVLVVEFGIWIGPIELRIWKTSCLILLFWTDAPLLFDRGF